ncbi:Protein_kinase-like domain superfamily [Hexamita inflata]|uniref:Protein_kinase-like domain superfamily n=1 Tax=Hexamita inflata TaxID=28002 RepID=A0ABP1K189_9EUKA
MKHVLHLFDQKQKYRKQLIILIILALSTLCTFIMSMVFMKSQKVFAIILLLVSIILLSCAAVIILQLRKISLKIKSFRFAFMNYFVKPVEELELRLSFMQEVLANAPISNIEIIKEIQNPLKEENITPEKVEEVQDSLSIQSESFEYKIDQLVQKFKTHTLYQSGQFHIRVMEVINTKFCDICIQIATSINQPGIIKFIDAFYITRNGKLMVCFVSPSGFAFSCTQDPYPNMDVLIGSTFAQRLCRSFQPIDIEEVDETNEEAIKAGITLRAEIFPFCQEASNVIIDYKGKILNAINMMPTEQAMLWYQKLDSLDGDLDYIIEGAQIVTIDQINQEQLMILYRIKNILVKHEILREQESVLLKTYHGTPLSVYIQRTQNFEQLVNICLQLSYLVTGLNENSVLHGQLQPDNIEVNEDKGISVRLINLSSAQLGDKFVKPIHSSSKYDAPELLSPIYDRFADVYSLGKLIQYILSKHLSSKSGQQLTYIIEKCLLPADKRACAKEISLDLERFIKTTFSKQQQKINVSDSLFNNPFNKNGYDQILSQSGPVTFMRVNQNLQWVFDSQITNGVFEVMNFKVNDVQKAIYFRNEWFAVQKEVVQVFNQEHVRQYQKENAKKYLKNNNVVVVASEGIQKSGQGREVVVEMDQQVVVECEEMTLSGNVCEVGENAFWMKNVKQLIEGAQVGLFDAEMQIMFNYNGVRVNLQ